MTVFLTVLFFFFLLTCIQGHSLMEPEAACSRRGNAHNRLAVYYRAHMDKQTLHTHTVPDSSWPIFLWTVGRLNPDKHSSCKLHRAKVQTHTVCETAGQTTEPLHHPHKQIIYKCSITIILSSVRSIFKSENLLGGKQPLALPQAKSPPVCVRVCCGYQNFRQEWITGSQWRLLLKEDSSKRLTSIISWEFYGKKHRRVEWINAWNMPSTRVGSKGVKQNV